MTKLEELVIEEAILLKQHATKEEINKLDYENINGRSPYDCVYGQMTSDCRSERAYELIKQCCQRVYKSGRHRGTLVGRLNGSPTELDNPSDRLDYYISPIENFLFKYIKDWYEESEKVEKLVAFLKGESDKLEF